jgi:hypothetical protein
MRISDENLGSPMVMKINLYENVAFWTGIIVAVVIGKI